MRLFMATLLLAASLVSCQWTGAVTGVTVTSTPANVIINSSSVLSAKVTGTGSFSPNVSWSIVSGGGSLNLNGSGATFVAPNTASTTIIKATSLQDLTKSGTVTVNTTTPSTGAVNR